MENAIFAFGPGQTFLFAGGPQECLISNALPKGLRRVVDEWDQHPGRKVYRAAFGAEVDCWHFAWVEPDGEIVHRFGNKIPPPLREYVYGKKNNFHDKPDLRVVFGESKHTFIAWNDDSICHWKLSEKLNTEVRGWFSVKTGWRYGLPIIVSLGSQRAFFTMMQNGRVKYHAKQPRLAENLARHQLSRFSDVAFVSLDAFHGECHIIVDRGRCWASKLSSNYERFVRQILWPANDFDIETRAILHQASEVKNRELEQKIEEAEDLGDKLLDRLARQKEARRKTKPNKGD
ncbi:hypothetical protein NA57DRAFT_81904 [Rhizodiscina lignyota]|uniref:Uncharacterized protein n=1 Tax=Rhizodiscina lignyota TaxID=1504668 RepID=A0A9P4M4D8_9PEZI|nr:hypothetical protein NA57DRAFT_81904 [Rhizodiscina lignyota]